jgi:putative transposase
VKSQDVYSFTLRTLDTLPLKRPGAIQSRDLLRVLIFAAASRLSVHQACCQLECAPSGPTVLGPLASQFRDLDALEDHLNDLLARLLPKGLRKRRRQVAMDVVALPYHGSVDDVHHDEVCRRKAKSGTTHFFTYATAYAVVRGRRSTLAMCRVRAKQTMDYVLRTLLARLVTLGIRIKLLLLDRGFYSVRVMRDLITAELPFIMPAVKRGKKPTTPGGPTGTYALAAETQSRWTSYTLKSPQEGQVEFDLAVVCRNTRGQRGRHQRETLLYATWGIQPRPWSWIRATYRSRFGIESSYRQGHQARIRTTSRKPALRLVFLGVAPGSYGRTRYALPACFCG